MKFGFVTCVQLGLSCIEKIYEIGGQLDLLITIPDHKSKNKSGRIYLDEISKRNNIPLLKVNHINDEEAKTQIKAHEIDWLFIIGWSQIASIELLACPTKGCIGMHPTLLPQGRGRAAIPWAIIKGLSKTGVSMFVLDEGVDTGDILGQYEIQIDEKETAGTLYDKVERGHIKLMEEVFPRLKNGEIFAYPQDAESATIWEGRKPEDGELFQEMTVDEADRIIRACTRPYPGAFISLKDKKRIIWKAEKTDDNTATTVLKFKDGYINMIQFEDIYT